MDKMKYNLISIFILTLVKNHFGTEMVLRFEKLLLLLPIRTIIPNKRLKRYVSSIRFATF